MIPARMLNEYVYCPRLTWLEWIESEWADNLETLEGKAAHRRADEASGEVPEGGEWPENHVVRALHLQAPDAGITARMDVVEGDAGEAIPVDYKRGSPPRSGLPYDPERVQLCAQGRVLRAHGYQSRRGHLYYVGSRKRVEVPFDEELERLTDEALEGCRQLRELPQAPEPLSDSPRCPRCSLVGICLPDEIGRAGEGTRSMHPARKEARPLYVQEQGCTIGIKAERVEVRRGKEVLQDMRLLDVDHLSVFGRVQITAQALAKFLDAHKPVCFFSYGGWFRGIAHGIGSRNGILRAAQHRVAEDGDRCRIIAASLVRSKIRNCRTLLRRNGAPRERCLEELRRLSVKVDNAGDLSELLGMEGSAAASYFGAFDTMLKPQGLDTRFAFKERNRRPPKDPVNAMLSYAYAVLAKDLTVTCLMVGLDPFRGFYHSLRHGRAALALDLMEPFRPLIADSVVLSAVNNGVVQDSDFVRKAGAVALKPAARRAFLQCYERRMDELVTHPVYGYRMSYRRVLEVHTRLLSRFLLGELKTPPLFETR